MRPIVAQRGQHHHHWLAVAVPIAALSTLACCRSDDRFELTLRSRDAFGPTGGLPCTTLGNQPVRGEESSPSGLRACALDFEQTQWRAADGRRAINQAHNVLRFLSLEHDDLVCGGQPITRQYQDARLELPADEQPFELTLDGGDTLRLESATGVWESASTGYVGLECFEANGRWRGVAGELQGRTGRFTMVYDSVQTVLQLVED